MLYKTVLNIYFIVFTVGIFMVLSQTTAAESTTYKIVTFIGTSAWLAFAWFFLRPREMKKIAKITESVNALQSISSQFVESV